MLESLIFLLMIPEPPILDSNIYYVDNITEDCSPLVTGSGTFQDPWTNLYYATTRGGLQPGDTLQLFEGIYSQDAPAFPKLNNEQEALSNCSVDPKNLSRKKTVLPILKGYIEGSPNNPIIIENYPGALVEITGTHSKFLTSNPWIQCNVPNTDVYYQDLNVGSSDSQFWANSEMVQMQERSLSWEGNGSCPSRSSFNFGDSLATAGNNTLVDEVVVSMKDSSNPNNYTWRYGTEGGEGAPHVVHNNSNWVTVRKHSSGGEFIISNGRYGVVNDDSIAGSEKGDNPGSYNIYDGLTITMVGSADYGIGFRNWQGNNNTYTNLVVYDIIAEGGGPYCGDTNQKGGSNCIGISITDSIIYNTGLGWHDIGNGEGSNLGHGLICRNCSDTIIKGNTVYNTYRAGISIGVGFQGPCHSGGGCKSNNILIEDNDIYAFGFAKLNNIQSCDTGSSGGIFVTNSSSIGEMDNLIIKNNYIHHSCILGGLTRGIMLSEQGGTITNWTIEGNKIEFMGGSCIYLRENKLGGSSGTINSNLMYTCGTNGGCGGIGCNLWLPNEISPSHNYNNYWNDNNVSVVRYDFSTTILRDEVIENFEPTALQTPNF